MPVQLVANLSPSFQSGLTTLSARVYTGSTLAAAVAMSESPAGSARYVGTFNAPAAAAVYQWTVVDAGGNGVWVGDFDTAGDGSRAVTATLDAGSIDGVRASLERAGGPLAAAAAAGSGLAPGASSLTWHITLDITGVLADADCWITRTSDPSTQVVDRGRTNTSGDVRFFADKFQVDGTTLVTYYGHAQKDKVMSLQAVPLTCD